MTSKSPTSYQKSPTFHQKSPTLYHKSPTSTFHDCCVLGSFDTIWNRKREGATFHDFGGFHMCVMMQNVCHSFMCATSHDFCGFCIREIALHQKSPTSYQKSPTLHQKSPTLHQKSPTLYLKSPTSTFHDCCGFYIRRNWLLICSTSLTLRRLTLLRRLQVGRESGREREQE